MRTGHFQAREQLSRVPAFAGLGAVRLKSLIDHSEVRELPRGAAVFQPGERCLGLHVVLDGAVKVFARAGDGHEKVIDIVLAGQTVAGTHLIEEAHASHAQTLEPSTMLIVSPAALRSAMRDDGEIGTRLLQDASRHVRHLMREIESTTLMSAMGRTCDYLLRQPDHDAPLPDGSRVVELPVSKGTVASLLSVTPEHFSRLLRELHDSGLIVMQQRTIRIPDPARLARHG